MASSVARAIVANFSGSSGTGGGAGGLWGCVTGGTGGVSRSELAELQLHGPDDLEIDRSRKPGCLAEPRFGWSLVDDAAVALGKLVRCLNPRRVRADDKGPGSFGNPLSLAGCS
jgi:hypothetical protein